MNVQRVRLPGSDRVTWLVLGDDYLPIPPVRAFLTYLNNLERSPHTVRAYAYHLKLFWDYLTDVHLDWTAVGLSELAAFVAWLRQPMPGVVSIHQQLAKRSESTINTILAAVAMFYDFHQRDGTVPHIPLYQSQVQPHRRYKGFLHHVTKGKPIQYRLLKLKVARCRPKTLTPDQVAQFIAVCDRLRDQLLVSLLYETGMRIGQALGLRHEDVQSWDNAIRVVPRANPLNQARTKTHEPYTIHVPPSLMGRYTDYLIHEFEATDSDYVFVNLWEGHIGAPIQYSTVAALFRRLSKKSGVSVTPHMLRHTHATELIRHGWDAAHVQKRLGHASIQTTLNIYTHLDDADMQAEYQTYLQQRAQP